MKSSYTRVVFLGISAVVFVVLLFFVIFMTFVFHIRQGEDIESSDRHVYNSMSFDPLTDTSSYGIISTTEGLGSEGFTSYINEAGTQILLSDVGLTEYKCIGTCYCSENEENERRIASAISSKGVVVLVAAMSLVAAFSKAKDDLEKGGCNSPIWDTNGCEYGKTRVSSDVHVCKVGEPYDPEIVEETTNGREKWFCQGICMTSSKLKTLISLKKAMEFGCFLEMDAVVDVDCTDLGYEACEKEAKEDFHAKYLKHYCKLNSNWGYTDPRTGEEYEENLCVDRVKEENQSVLCRELTWKGVFMQEYEKYKPRWTHYD